MRAWLLFVLTVSGAVAADLDCAGCVHAVDIHNWAISTQEIGKQAVAEGKLADSVRQKLNGLVVTDGVGRRLPIEVGRANAAVATGYWQLESGGIVPIRIARRAIDQPHQIFGASWGFEVVGNQVQPVSHVLFTGPGCTGFSYFVSFEASAPEFLFPYIVIRDWSAPNRARHILRVGDRVNESLLPLSFADDIDGCVEADPDHPWPHLPHLSDSDLARIDPAVLENPGYIAAITEHSFRWVPPLRIRAP